LGKPEIARLYVDRLRGLPKRFHPTRFHDVFTKVHSFSFDDPSSFIESVPGPHPYNGMVSLYKIRHIATYLIDWSKGSSSWFRDHPQQKLNGFGGNLRGGEQIVKSRRTFAEIRRVWLELCQDVSALYGYLYLSLDDGYRPRGEGRCLPRLRWQTFFGPEYTGAFGLRESPELPGATVTDVGETSTLVQIDTPPETLDKPGDLERTIIEDLGETYFWGYARDDWRNPKLHYDQPEIDWSEIISE
jgi:hypothetical protein